MALDRGWRIIIRFAFAGFVLGLLSESGIVLAQFSVPLIWKIVAALATLLSPGAWMFPELAWGPASGWFKLAFVASANSVLYTILGAIIAGLSVKSGDFPAK
jgi:hypothetical protein